MKQRLLVSSIIMGLCASLATGSVIAQNADQNSAGADQKKKEPAELQKVVVTGSLIPQAQIETASPTITITAKDMQKQGFANVYDALRSMPIATGAVQDGQFQGGFTQGAHELSLLGLDPGFTLTLIDGHPMADYPLLFNGTSNFVDLTNIPVGMIDHIDILPGNQSAIYGSNAIAGVINIILKQKVDGFEVDYRVGGFSNGGGQSQRLELLGGHDFGNLSVVYGLQISNTDPIWGYQRDLTASQNANPNPAGRFGSSTFGYWYYDNSFVLHRVDPGAATCAQVAGNFHGTTIYDHSASGYYCGSRYETGYGTINSQSRQASGYLKITDRINDNIELYGNLLFNANTQHYSDGRRFWNVTFLNQDTQRLELFQHIFSPEESGGLGVGMIHDLSRNYNFYGGARGGIGSSSWNYDVFVDRSGAFNDTKELWPLKAPVTSFFEQQFLGPKQGTSSGYPVYSPNPSKFYQSLTPAQYASFQGQIESQSKTWTQHINLQVTNTDLFTLPGGSAGIAGVLQLGDQYWSNPVQASLQNGEFFGRTGTAGNGQRSNWAAAVELRAPVLSTVTLTASLRYDKYENDGGGSYDKPTYKLGAEYRPVDTLLFRANYGTAFRAPDMAYTFGGKSGSFQPGLTDYYLCATKQPGDITKCSYYNTVDPFIQHQGNRGLQPVTAKSWGGGLVWSPTSDLTLKADYYKIKISNEVNLQSADTLLVTESACRLGQLDINSPTCVDALSKVQRGPQGQITQINVLPINISSESVSGVIASANYKLDVGRYGDFQFGLNYNDTLKHSHQTFPGDPTYNNFDDPFNASTIEFKSILTGSVTWDIGPWSTTVFGTRYGAIPNHKAYTVGSFVAGAGHVAPWMIYNGSVSYSFSDDATMSFIVNNIQNSMPPKDPTYTSVPYYNYQVYNVYGRSMFLEMNVKFGRSK